MRAIDADAFKDYIRGACEDMKHLFNDNGAVAKLITESFCKDIDEQPTIQPTERKIGEWIYDWGDWDFETCKCSECGNHMTTPIGKRYNFCPNCGADMRQKGENNESN